jgi:hypothetical protein
MLQNNYKIMLKFKSHETTPPKANPGVCVMMDITFKGMADWAMDHLHEGVRHQAKTCVELACNAPVS